MVREEAEKLLFQTFKLEKFYDDQWIVIQKLLEKKRVLLIEKTGYGKSLCFQFPATILPGITIIFTPLIALMREQVKRLKGLGIKAESINYQMDEHEISDVINLAINNQLKILYISPERIGNNEWQSAVIKMDISMVVVDEAHCISTWGHDFRPDYQRIVNLIKVMPQNFPILATTATATKRVETDIQAQIGNNTTIIRGNLLRKNLSLNVINLNSEEEKMIWLLHYLPKLEGNGIIYAGTRASAEIYNSLLEQNGINTVYYHADVSKKRRIEIENGLMTNKYKVVVSTNALGMGIDKSDIRFLIHLQMPQSPIHYYQEVGRAGRDNKPAFIFLLFNQSKDLELPLSFIETARPSYDKYQKVIKALKTRIMSLYELIDAVNIKQNIVLLILNDLINQKIINKNEISRKKVYEYRFGAPTFDYSKFEELKKLRMVEMEDMINYTKLTNCRMKFLCDYLGDNQEDNCGSCDNDTNKRYSLIKSDYLTTKVNNFSFYPEILNSTTNTKLLTGFASSHYGFSKVGTLINKSKYQHGGDFSDELVDGVIRLYNKRYKEINYDIILFVPPTESGDLVKNFAMKISKALGIPISNKLVKTRNTSPQKQFESSLSKKNNVKDAFSYTNPDELFDKSILLIDDVYDDGATIKEIANLLTKLNVKSIRPIVIAKTVGGIK